MSETIKDLTHQNRFLKDRIIQLEHILETKEVVARNLLNQKIHNERTWQERHRTDVTRYKTHLNELRGKTETGLNNLREWLQQIAATGWTPDNEQFINEYIHDLIQELIYPKPRSGGVEGEGSPTRPATK